MTFPDCLLPLCPATQRSPWKNKELGALRGLGGRTWETEGVPSDHGGDFRLGREGSPFLVTQNQTVAGSYYYYLLFLSLGRLTHFTPPPPIVLG